MLSVLSQNSTAYNFHRAGLPAWPQLKWHKRARIVGASLPHGRAPRCESARPNPQPRGLQDPRAPQAQCDPCQVSRGSLNKRPLGHEFRDMCMYRRIFLCSPPSCDLPFWAFCVHFSSAVAHLAWNNLSGAAYLPHSSDPRPRLPWKPAFRNHRRASLAPKSP